MQLLEQRSPLQAKLVVWRRGTHEHPELSNQEQQTAAMMAQSSAGTPTALTTA
jgi:metal-dependent amidase/aminoacylase/carboxypeptidase family protein